MNYYIKGDAAKAEQIKAAFEKLGYDTSFVQKLSASGSHILFTLPCDTRVHAFHTAYIEADILKRLVNIDPEYKELELPVEPKFKVGDWIVNNNSGGVHQVTEIIDDEYCIWPLNAEIMGYLRIIDVDDEYHLWTIADAKDGDVLVYQDEIFLFNLVDINSVLYHCCFDGNLVVHSFYGFSNEDLLHVHPATKEQRDLLFIKIQEAGYTWDGNKKELKKIPKHYDIANFHAGMPVLVRDETYDVWQYVLFSHNTSNREYHFCAGGGDFKQCIPFEGNEHLLGTTDMPDEMYINW